MKTATEADINRWLLEYDEKHFAGNLSIWKVVIGIHSDMKTESEGCCVREERTIYLSKVILDHPETFIKEILIHEIAHIRGGDYHGKKFKTELRRLQQEGAPVNELDFADVHYATGKEVLRWVDRTIGMGATVEQAQEYVADKYGISVEEFVRNHPKASKGTPGLDEALNAPPPWHIISD